MRRILNTLRYLKTRQLFYLLKHRLSPLLPSEKPAAAPQAAVQHAASLSLPEEVKQTFPSPPALDWKLIQAFISGKIQPSQLPLLEQFHLHYFHYLFHPQFSEAQALKILNRWLTRHPPGDQPAWHPYPLSLRVGNWILYYLSHKPLFQQHRQLEQQLLSNLHQQAQMLRRQFEFHLMGNHLLENARALVMAGVLFNEAQWIHYGGKILHEQLQEQFTADGGHFENSTLYQNILLKHLLDTLLIITYCAPRADTSMITSLHTALAAVLPKAGTFLIRMGGDLPEPPLWGDTALDMMYPFEELATYYQAVLQTPLEHPAEAFYLSPTGYGMYRNTSEIFIFDAAPLGPDYQPGHAHCDLLSFTYHFKTLPFFIDSGLGNYRETPLRDYARSTAAHNTVTVNGLPQAECWKSFRMGRRVSPGGLTQPAPNQMQGWYHHQWAPKPQQYTHIRSVQRLSSGHWFIQDEITGDNGPVVARFHLHPGITIERPEAEVPLLQLRHNGTSLYFCWKPATLSFAIEEGWYVPTYDAPQQHKTLVFQTSMQHHRKLQFAICKTLAKAKEFLQHT